MSYRLDFTTSAAREVKKLPRPARDRVLVAIEDLAEDPRPHGAKKLVDEVLTVTVIRVAHRREVYDR